MRVTSESARHSTAQQLRQGAGYRGSRGKQLLRLGALSTFSRGERPLAASVGPGGRSGDFRPRPLPLRGSSVVAAMISAASRAGNAEFRASACRTPAVVFPDQVDQGSRKPETWPWILTRVRDANGVKPPRNLIDLVLKAQAQQLKKEEREPRTFERGHDRLITGDALKKGLQALSEARVQDTLLAEAGDNAELIELFRNGKAEHNLETLSALLGDDAVGKIELLKTLATGRRLDGSVMSGFAAHSDVLNEPSDAWRNNLGVITGDGNVVGQR